MKTFKFTVAEHEEFGSKGFKPAWYPNGDPLGGMAVAHDILEHFPNDEGEIEGEMMALGASLWIRGESGYFQRNGNVNPPEAHLASDFPMIWQHTTERDRRTFVKECSAIREKDITNRCREIVRLGINNMRTEYSFDKFELPDKTARERMALWMAKGYTKAVKRYHPIDCCTVAWCFQQIEEAADKALKYIDDYEVFFVRINFKSLEVKTWTAYPKEEHY